jgi:hypothetical protein
MVTDTAPLRYRHHHRATDSPAHVDFDALSMVTKGLVGVVRDLAQVSFGGW